jgi:hypothetical protein
MDIPKSFSESSNYSFEFAINMLQSIEDLWAQYFGSESRIAIESGVITHTTDGRVTIRGFPYNTGGHGIGIGGSTAVLGLAGRWDRTIYAKNDPGSRNKTQNFWQSTLIAGIVDDDLRDLALDVSARIGAISLLLQAGLGRGAGISSRSFSVGGISSSYSTTESAENSLYSGVITDLQRTLGVGKATKEERSAGLVNMLKRKVEGGSMGFKY